MSKRPILLTVFIHEDLGSYNEDKLYLDHFDWIADKIASLSGRTMDVVFVPPSDSPFISNIDYKTDNIGSLLAKLSYQIEIHLNTSQNTIVDNSIHKFLLLTRDNINDEMLGAAYSPGQLGISSITTKIAAAHEVGHMFDARHEDSEVNAETYYGIAKTIMYPIAESPVAFRFSDKNLENIKTYLNRFA
ncbi:zinc-dependent metalloprotease [Pseudomonas sp. PD9R]|uniref:zinc-dependent metalloprotease n=1 Tax=Pseudomonas sp. PD9R TaxID=2853534 RepID=UPI001C45986A|nr:zinc-dependent metalloprotease [Pseudomonas sp. PD9R]MBV6825342.1 zinc-dependent metalloprotease [Pseudomonas sp. PD9R]